MSVDAPARGGFVEFVRTARFGDVAEEGRFAGMDGARGEDEDLGERVC